MPRIDRAEVLRRLRAKISRHEPIIGGGAGTRPVGKMRRDGWHRPHRHLQLRYNSGRFRMAGRGSLAGLMAYGDANTIVVELGREVLPVVSHVPVLAGVNGTDPFYDPETFLADLDRMGFSGVQNFPTVGLIDGTFRANLEETGMGYSLEFDMIRVASRMGLFTSPYVFSSEDATTMAEAGADGPGVPHGLDCWRVYRGGDS